MASTDAAEKKRTLHREIEALKAELSPVFQRDRARVEAEGRPFSAAAWWGGELDDGKYPAGPAFYVRLPFSFTRVLLLVCALFFLFSFFFFLFSPCLC